MKSLLCYQHVVLLAIASFLAVGGTSLIADEVHHENANSTGASAAEVDPLTNLLFPEEPDYNLPPVQPNLSMFLWTLILFAVFIFVMKQTTWSPLITAINDREAKVIHAGRDAEIARREVAKLRAESEARMAEVQNQVKALIAEARSEAEARKRDIVAEAEQEARKIKEEALREIDAAHRAALENLDQMVDDQVALATEHVVGRRL